MTITKKQKAVYDFITNYSETHGLAPTQKEIKEHFGLKSFGSVQKYLKYLVESGHLEMDWNARRGLKVVEDNLSKEKNISVELPLLGLIAAGNPIEALENPSETIEVPSYMIRSPGKHFALTVRGDSMIDAGILEDDIVICKSTQHAQQGQIAVAIIDGEATLKYFYQFANYIELRPANVRLSPIIIREGNFQIAGVIAGLLRSY